MSDYIALETEEQFYSLLNKAVSFYFKQGKPVNCFVYKIIKRGYDLYAQCIDFSNYYTEVFFDLADGYAIFPPSILLDWQRTRIFENIFVYGQIR